MTPVRFDSLQIGDLFGNWVFDHDWRLCRKVEDDVCQVVEVNPGDVGVRILMPAGEAVLPFESVEQFREW